MFVLTLGVLAYIWPASPARTNTPTGSTTTSQEVSQPEQPALPPKPVETALNEPAPPAAAPSTENGVPAEAPRSFAIEMATLETPAGAERAVRELGAAGYRAYSRELTLKSGGPAYAVFLGPYPDMTEAQRDFEQAQGIRGYTAGRIVGVDAP
jgi:cell division septation protein DedD